MQELVYDEAPYHILYYDAELHAYRTDKFGGWTNQPAENGTPLFGYGTVRLHAADGPRRPAEPGAASGAAAAPGGAGPTPAPSATARPPTSGSDDVELPLILGIGGARRGHRGRARRHAPAGAPTVEEE